MGSRPLVFLRKWWGKFITTGNLADAHRSGRPPLLPDEVALEAAELVKAGRWVPMKPTSKGIVKQLPFRSIPQAIQQVPELHDICQQYGLDSKQLREAMVRVDDDLTFHVERFKFTFSAERLEGRQNFCLARLGWLDLSLPAATYQLERMVWWDEGGVAISALQRKSIRVWGSKAGLRECDVIHLPAVKGQEDCKIHFVMAVSSHPAYSSTNGLVYFEFTTGTTAMKRLRNTLGQDGDDAYQYMVSYKPFTYYVVKCIMTHLAVHMYCLKELCHMTTCFLTVAMCEHHATLSCSRSYCCQHC